MHQGALRFVFPALVLIALIEALALARRAPERLDWKESAATLGVALGHSAVGLATRGLVGGVLYFVWDHRLATVAVNRLPGMLALLVASEFFYYWEHRLSHIMRWFWASHSVHHSPRHLNFSAAYRLGWTGALSGLPFIFAPMVLLGFSPISVAAMLAINLLYQFWLHNEWVPRLGPIEWIFNTPSSHRVHHATNAQYIDRNYGGILIIFDRLFGSYVTEQEPCVYGLADGAHSYNPLRIALSEWHSMGRDLRLAGSWQERFVTIFGAPAGQLGGDASPGAANERYDAPLATRDAS
jgi:sterol desaturase/sphingolipid hydroxylase (fatty acid hydroxylase superfamily)